MKWTKENNWFCMLHRIWKWNQKETGCLLHSELWYIKSFAHFLSELNKQLLSKGSVHLWSRILDVIVCSLCKYYIGPLEALCSFYYPKSPHRFLYLNRKGENNVLIWSWCLHRQKQVMVWRSGSKVQEALGPGQIHLCSWKYKYFENQGMVWHLTAPCSHFRECWALTPKALGPSTKSWPMLGWAPWAAAWRSCSDGLCDLQELLHQ